MVTLIIVVMMVTGFGEVVVVLVVVVVGRAGRRERETERLVITLSLYNVWLCVCGSVYIDGQYREVMAAVMAVETVQTIVNKV